jgi:orotidine-5'-phosphate decarboxylase
VAKAGVRFLSVHAVKQVMHAAVEGRADLPLRLLAVTVLTSLDDSDLREMGYALNTQELVLKRVHHAAAAGIDGVVCSPLEVRSVRSAAGPDTILVTPGVRSAGTSAGDQKRVATPAEALANGADYLVIGRQVTRAANPKAALEAIFEEIETSRVRS